MARKKTAGPKKSGAQRPKKSGTKKGVPKRDERRIDTSVPSNDEGDDLWRGGSKIKPADVEKDQ